MKLDLSSLPKFIDGSGRSIWRLPDQYPPTDFETVYVKLADVEKLLEEPPATLDDLKKVIRQFNEISPFL